jgi:hypothetical protein
MKKYLLLSIALLSILPSFSQKIDDPNAELREAKNFHAISVSNAFDVYISQGSEETVAISAAEQKYKDHIKVEVDNGVLRISFDRDRKFWQGWNGNKMRLKAYISFKSIDKLTASGACDVLIQGTLQQENLDINLSGASDMKGKFAVQNLDVDISGASQMDVTGSAQKLHVEASGASDFKGFDMVTEFCDAEASGASNIHITVNKELSAHASGASDVLYKGSGIVRDVRSSGASSVSKKS